LTTGQRETECCDSTHSKANSEDCWNPLDRPRVHDLGRTQYRDHPACWLVIAIGHVDRVADLGQGTQSGGRVASAAGTDQVRVRPRDGPLLRVSGRSWNQVVINDQACTQLETAGSRTR
jgi:hypothetical protein